MNQFNFGVTLFAILFSTSGQASNDELKGYWTGNGKGELSRVGQFNPNCKTEAEIDFSGRSLQVSSLVFSCGSQFGIRGLRVEEKNGEVFFENQKVGFYRENHFFASFNQSESDGNYTILNVEFEKTNDALSTTFQIFQKTKSELGWAIFTGKLKPKKLEPISPEPQFELHKQDSVCLILPYDVTVGNIPKCDKPR